MGEAETAIQLKAQVSSSGTRAGSSAVQLKEKVVHAHMGERLEDFQQLCSSTYGVDPIASLLLAAALVARLDLMIESGHHPFWEHLSYALVRNGQPGVGYAGQQPRAGRAFDERPEGVLLRRDDGQEQPRLTLAGYGPSSFRRGHAYWQACHRSLRAAIPLVERHPEEKAREELTWVLGRLIRVGAVIEPWPLPAMVPGVVRAMGQLRYEIDWNPKVAAMLARLAPASAYLHGRQVQDEDWFLLRFVLNGMMTRGMREMLGWFWENTLAFPMSERVERRPYRPIFIRMFRKRYYQSEGRGLDLAWLERREILHTHYWKTVDPVKRRPKFYPVIDLGKTGELLARLLYDGEFDWRHVEVNDEVTARDEMLRMSIVKENERREKMIARREERRERERERKVFEARRALVIGEEPEEEPEIEL